MVTPPPLEETRVNREQENNRVWINRLPTEILSRIFIIGEDMDQDRESSDGHVLQFQELVVQVCRKWRAVATNMPMLWTYIYISGLKSFDSASAFLERSERSGQTIPLEIEIDPPEHLHSDIDSYAEDADEQEPEAKLVQETLEFLVSKGANPSRWARLAIWFEKPKALFTIIDFLIDAPLDNMRKLSLVNTYIDSMMVEDYVVEAMRNRNLSDSALFRTPPPLLQELELVGIPSGFFFARENASLVSNLTHLELGFLLFLPPLVGLHTLLARNPRLESLCLDTGMIETTTFEHKNVNEMRITMPFLRRFSLQEPISVDWGLSVLQMIDAPGLEAFALNLDQSQTIPDSIPFHIAYGREITNGEARPEPLLPRHPIYPALKHLALGPFTGTSLSLVALLEALGTITRLDWELQEEEPVTINQVLRDSTFCPRLEHIRVHGVHETDLVDLVESRVRTGSPLKIVEVNSRDWPNYLTSTKSTLSKMLDKFGAYVDENESDSDTSSSDSGSDSDSNGWTDTDLSDTEGILMSGGDDSDDDSTDDGDDDGSAELDEDPHTLSDEDVFTDGGSISDLD
ncbi:unnamed protein product [Rhizoctonia solani]|uniref:F-box domain-containing protein n=1 Tax=Rhizoctonia solani TaxID=456999 RepID=A0A8H3D4Z6_9AGAM|nr:unnamed protein product [Rhizoctonia solani]